MVYTNIGNNGQNDILVNNTFSEAYHTVRTVYNNLLVINAVNNSSNDIELLNNNLVNINTVSNNINSINSVNNNLDIIEDTASIINELNGKYINNIATLRTTEPAYSKQFIYLIKHTVTDIGGGLFYYDDTDTTSTDDNGITIVTASGKRWKRVLEDKAVNVKFYGALGDGVNDDTIAFETALSKNPSVLYVSAGTYIVNPTNNSHITVGSSTRIVGDGIGISIIKLANNAIVNTDLIYNKFKSIFRCVAPTIAFGIVGITLDGNRENQLYPLTKRTSVGRGILGSGGTLELTPSNTQRGTGGILDCEVKNGYFIGVLASQCDDLDIKYLIVKNNARDGLRLNACNRPIVTIRTARNGYFRRTSPDNGWSNIGDVCGVHLKGVAYNASQEKLGYPILQYQYGDYWNGATINLESSEDDGTCCLWAGDGGNLNFRGGVLKNIGRNSVQHNYNPAFVWLEQVFGINHIDMGVCVQEDIWENDKPVVGIVAIPQVGEKDITEQVFDFDVGLPEGEGHIFVKSISCVSNQNFTEELGDFDNTENWKNNFIHFVRGGLNTTIDYIYGEGVTDDCITLSNAFPGDYSSNNVCPKNFIVHKGKFRNFLKGIVEINKLNPANAEVSNLQFLGFDVSHNRSTYATNNTFANCFRWVSGFGEITSKNIKIEGIFDLTNIDDLSKKMDLISFRGTDDSTLFIDADVYGGNYISYSVAGNGYFDIKGHYDCVSLLHYNNNTSNTKGIVFDGYAKCSNAVIAGIANNKIIDTIHINGIIDGNGSSSAIISNYPNINIKDEKITATTTNHTLAYTASNLTNGSIGSSLNSGLHYAKFLNYNQVSYTADQQGVMLFPFITPVGTINPRPINTSGATIASLSGNFKLRERVKKNTDLEGVSIQSLTTISAYSQVVFNVTVSGAMIGDFITSIAYSNAMSLGSNHVYLNGYVSSANTVTVVLTNRGSGTFTFNTDVLFKVLVTPRLSCKSVISVAYDPASLSVGNLASVSASASDSTTISFANAILGDFVLCSFTNNLSNVVQQAYVSSNGIVTIRFQNWSASVVDLPVGTLYVAIDN